MQWSMSRRTLQVVATGLVLVAVTAFGLGAWNAPSRGRMPGERANGAAGSAGAGAAINATDATPLGVDRIEGLAPRELTDEEREKLQEAKEAREEADAATRAVAETAAPPTGAAPATPAGPTPAPPPPPAPAPDEAPH